MNIASHTNKFKKMLQDNLLQKIIKNSGIILFGNSTASALNLISFTIMVKQIGPESFAILVLAQTYAIIINDLFNIQTWESMIKFGAKEFKSNSINNVIKTNFILDLISAIAAFVFALLLLKPAVYILGWDESYSNVFMLFSFSILFNLTTLTIGIPRLFNKYLSVAIIYVVTALLKMGCILSAMFFVNSFIIYVYIYLCFDVLTNLSLIVYSMKLLKTNYGSYWWKELFQIDRNQIKFIWWTNLRTIVRIPARHLDMVIISMVISIKMVGVYKVYKEIASLIHRIGEPVNQSIFPEFSKLLGNNNINKTISVTKKTMLLLAGVGAMITISMLICSKSLVGTFFGEEFLTDINALYMMLVLFGVSFITVPINSLFIAAGFVKYSFMILLFINIVYLITAFGFGTLFGIYGLILAYAIQLVFNKGLKIFFLKKYSSDWGSTIR